MGICVSFIEKYKSFRVCEPHRVSVRFYCLALAASGWVRTLDIELVDQAFGGDAANDGCGRFSFQYQLPLLFPQGIVHRAQDVAVLAHGGQRLLQARR